MTKTEKIRTFDGFIIGTIETSDNGDQIARDFPSCQILGRYFKDRDVTTDFVGRIVARGNTLVSFIWEKHGGK